MPTIDMNGALSAVDHDKLVREARLSELSGHWERAEQEFAELVRLYPNDPFFLESLARAQRKLGKDKAWAESNARAIRSYFALGMPGKAAQLQGQRPLALPR